MIHMKKLNNLHFCNTMLEKIIYLLTAQGESNMIIKLRVLKLRAIFKAEDSGELPAFLGSTIRGVLGHSMRNSVCVNPNVRCYVCEFANSCKYTAYFSTAGNIAGSVNPFTIYIPLQNKTNWERGDLLTFDITAFGHAALAADFYIDGILRMGEYGWGARRLKFSPVQIINVYDQSLIWSDDEIWTQNFRHHLIRTKSRETNSVLLRFNSPTRVVIKQKLQKRLTFEHIIKSILTRIRLLLHAYEDVVLNWNETEILKIAKEIETIEENWQFIDFKRYSHTRQGKLGLPSIKGYARFKGNITPFTPLLEIGNIIQIGKNTTHGFGNYDLYYV